MANSDQQPWAPDPDTAPGTPPVNGTGGERGTSAFDGNATYDYQGRPIGTNPARGPRLGKDYAVANGTDTVGTVSARGLVGFAVEAAGTHALVTPTNVVTSSSLTPSANTSVTLTATLTSTQTWPWAGTVTFKDGASTIGTGTVNSSGVATYVHSAGFAAGAHSITAVYGGNTNWATVTSAAITVTAS